MTNTLFSLITATEQIFFAYAWTTPPGGLEIYTPTAPEISVKHIASELQDGNPVQLVTHRNIKETLPLILTAANKAALITLIEQIEALLIKAEHRQRWKTGEQVRLRAEIDGDSAIWESEIFAGRLDLDPLTATQPVWDTLKIRAKLHIERAWYWECTSNEEAPLSILGGTPTTGGKPISNCTGLGRTNSLDIPANTIGGNLPTPARILLTNNSGSPQSYRNLYLANNASADPPNFAATIQGEAATGIASIASGFCANNAYGALTFTGTTILKYTLPAALLQKAEGRPFRLLVRFAGYTATPIYITPLLMDSAGLITLTPGNERRLPLTGDELVDLGCLRLPEGDNYTTWADHVLGLHLRSSALVNINIDYIQLTPLDSYRHIVQRGYSLDNGETIDDNGIQGITYVSGQRIYSPRGAPLMLFPKVAQRIHILHDLGTTAPIDSTLSVRIYYRRRRLTL